MEFMLLSLYFFVMNVLFIKAYSSMNMFMFFQVFFALSLFWLLYWDLSLETLMLAMKQGNGYILLVPWYTN